VPGALAVNVTSPQSSWGAPFHDSLSFTLCPGSNSAGIRVSPRDSNVRPNSPCAFSVTFGSRVTLPVLCSV
jgi:hypothetical protein